MTYVVQYLDPDSGELRLASFYERADADEFAIAVDSDVGVEVDEPPYWVRAPR